LTRPRPGGRHLPQIGNSLHAEMCMPTKTYIEGDGGIEPIDQRWNADALPGRNGRLDPGRRGVRGVPSRAVRKRLYSVEELTEIYAS
jgi:hypothetical protein